jgi:hypothetical protein
MIFIPFSIDKCIFACWFCAKILFQSSVDQYANSIYISECSVGGEEKKISFSQIMLHLTHLHI